MSKRAVFVRVRGSLVPAFLGLVAAAARSNDFDATRNTPARGSLGADLFGVVCDRMGGQSLHEDLSGGSFRVLCHGENGADRPGVGAQSPVQGAGLGSSAVLRASSRAKPSR